MSTWRCAAIVRAKPVISSVGGSTVRGDGAAASDRRMTLAKIISGSGRRNSVAKSYPASVAAEYASGCVWTVAGGVILRCIVYPPALIGVRVLAAAWIVLSVASYSPPCKGVRRDPRHTERWRGWTSPLPSGGRPPFRPATLFGPHRLISAVRTTKHQIRFQKFDGFVPCLGI